VALALSLCAVAVLSAAAWYLARRAGGRRHAAVAAVLDAADALEARLRTAREEIHAVAGDGDDPVRGALQEMLRQRLWLKAHGARASLDELARVRASIDAARQRIDQQLGRIADARRSA
jgi:hypothetical protein